VSAWRAPSVTELPPGDAEAVRRDIEIHPEAWRDVTPEAPPPAGHNINGASMPDDKLPAWATPCELTLEDAAEASTGPGRHRHLLEVLIDAAFDLRVGECPLPYLLLAAVAEHVNRETGLACPGNDRLAQEILDRLAKMPAGERKPALDNAVTRVRLSGHAVTDRRSPPRGGRAVRHFALTRPNMTREQKLAVVAAFLAEQAEENEARRARIKRAKEKADLTATVRSETHPDLTAAVKSADLTATVRSGADLTATGNSDLTATGNFSAPLSITEPTRSEPEESLVADATRGDLFSDGDFDHGGASSERVEPEAKDTPCKPSPSAADIKLAFTLYLETAGRCGLAKPRKVDPWVPNLKARLREHGIDGWREVLAKVEASPFLRGEKTSFRADLDWLSGPKNFAKVLAGKYDDQHKPKPKKLTRY
jgi:hypothetical protein